MHFTNFPFKETEVLTSQELHVGLTQFLLKPFTVRQRTVKKLIYKHSGTHYSYTFTKRKNYSKTTVFFSQTVFAKNLPCKSELSGIQGRQRIFKFGRPSLQPSRVRGRVGLQFFCKSGPVHPPNGRQVAGTWTLGQAYWSSLGQGSEPVMGRDCRWTRVVRRRL